jgi:hypothetical protein
MEGYWIFLFDLPFLTNDLDVITSVIAGGDNVFFYTVKSALTQETQGPYSGEGTETFSVSVLDTLTVRIQHNNEAPPATLDVVIDDGAPQRVGDGESPNYLNQDEYSDFIFAMNASHQLVIVRYDEVQT